MALIDKLTAIANAIRSKTGSTDPLSLDDMPTAIEGIQSGSGGESTAVEPYIEETYDDSGGLIDVNMVGYSKVRSYAFYGCKKLALTSLPSGLTSIGSYAFYNCSNLALTSLPSGLTNIESYAFQNCKNLALTSLPSGLTNISDSAFSSCSNLALTSLPSGLTSIGNYAFSSCSNLALTSLPYGITSIGREAFYGCSNLALTSFPDSITSIGQWAFRDCTLLPSTIVLPSSLTIFNSGVFKGVNVTTITFTRKLTSVMSDMLSISDYPNLTTINVPWSQGEVNYAPWGAKNATINYNYTG